MDKLTHACDPVDHEADTSHIDAHLEESETLTSETNEERFKRVATRRLRASLKQMQLLQNCANKASYAFTEDQVTTIVTLLEREIEKIKRTFSGDKDEQSEVSL